MAQCSEPAEKVPGRKGADAAGGLCLLVSAASMARMILSATPAFFTPSNPLAETSKLTSLAGGSDLRQGRHSPWPRHPHWSAGPWVCLVRATLRWPGRIQTLRASAA